MSLNDKILVIENTTTKDYDKIFGLTPGDYNVYIKLMKIDQEKAQSNFKIDGSRAKNTNKDKN